MHRPLYGFILGHYNFTFILSDKGFNELEMTLLRHLIHNKRPMSFIRTQCDSAVQGIIHDEFNQVSLSNLFGY